jgi:hypothetical protein
MTTGKEEERLLRRLADLDQSRREDAMEAAENYLSRGRLFSELSDDDLLLKWTEVREAHTDSPLDQDLQQTEDDLTVECGFRGLKPPYSEENLARFLENTRKAIKGQ